jgi:hypothetical protein
MIPTKQKDRSATQTTTAALAARPKPQSCRELATRGALLLGFLLLCLLSTSVRATDVKGTIVNQTWTSNNSPYRVVGDILVAGLTIRPGVTVLFTNNYAFEVAGKLTARGTTTAPIVFMGTNGGWQGIYFNRTGPGSTLVYCTVSNSVNSGIRIVDSSPMISDCLIANNSAPVNGGGISANISSTGDVTLFNCVITNNTVGKPFDGSLSGDVGYGGGVFAQLGTGAIRMDACLVSENGVNPQQSNFGTYAGGGVYVSAGSCSLSYCVVRNNVCVSMQYCGASENASGGGIYSARGSAELKNCIVSGNYVHTDTGTCPATAYGGGIYAYQGSLSMTNCVVFNNTVASPTLQRGGGLYMSSQLGEARIVNCTLAYNNMQGLYSEISGVLVVNSIVYFNENQIVGTTNATYCDVQGGGVAGTGNIDANPIFLGTDNLIIVSGSPCINKGSTNAAYRDVYFPPSLGSSRNDMGAHGGPGAGASLRIEAWPEVKVFLLGGVPGYNYLIQASTNLSDWQSVQPVQIAHLGDLAYYLEPSTNTLPRRFYKVSLAP